jgi:formylmethanofuran dehydrogenase subunit E
MNPFTFTPPTMFERSFRLLAIFAILSGCASAPNPHPSSGPHAHPPLAAPASGIDAALAEVARVHGAAGPWAVAGYRMGKHALAKLGLERQSFDLEIVHKSPRSVQFSCIADGASAATGASLGKLNLGFEEVAPDNLKTVYRNRATGVSITLRPTAAFMARYRDLPDGEIARAGREVMELGDAEIFEEVSIP